MGFGLRTSTLGVELEAVEVEVAVVSIWLRWRWYGFGCSSGVGLEVGLLLIGGIGGGVVWIWSSIWLLWRIGVGLADWLPIWRLWCGFGGGVVVD
ncbi:hypothetical protein LWI28_013854 [Acer negundo]|uniref:Transmembrane protein n=1 Tax=Acer negundo TaxID=4023 RepID=A0AAD5NWS1_ACENE|nr:hypothetical protein LWI28_013854 [Acer negundo]